MHFKIASYYESHFLQSAKYPYFCSAKSMQKLSGLLPRRDYLLVKTELACRTPQETVPNCFLRQTTAGSQARSVLTTSNQGSSGARNFLSSSVRLESEGS